MSNHDSISFSTTLHVRDTCLCLHVQRAARALARRFDEAFRPVGLTNGQFSLLMSLNRPEPPTMRDVAQLLAMDRTTLTAALKPLVRRRLVKAAPDKDDKRSRRLSLSALGRDLLGEAMPIWKREHAALDRELGSNTDSLRTALLIISGSATNMAKPPSAPARKRAVPSAV